MRNIKKVILITTISLLSIMILAYGIGIALPVENTIEITKTFKQSKREIWNMIAEPPEDTVNWSKELERIKRLPTSNSKFPIWQEYYKKGLTLTLQTESATPGEQLVIKIIDEKGNQLGTRTYDFTSLTNGGTKLSITQTIRTNSPLERLKKQFYYGKNYPIENCLQSLETELEKRS